MNKILLTLSFIVASIAGSAQFVELSNEVNTALGSSANTGEILDLHWDVINVSGSTRNIRCRREIIQDVIGAEHQFCWGEICGPWSNSAELSTEIVSLTDGDTTFSFYCKYRHNGNPGQSIVRFCWFDANDVLSQLCYQVNFCVDQACVLGVDENESPARFQILGNPVTALSGISYQFATPPAQAELLIFNATGTLVESRAISSSHGVALIDANQFANGIYTCKLNENGRTVGIQRMVVSK